MTESDLAALRAKCPTGWQETVTADNGVTFDQWCVPFDGADDDDFPAMPVTLQPSGAWTVVISGRLIETGAAVAGEGSSSPDRCSPALDGLSETS
jgi:hypothetical protein